MKIFGEGQGTSRARSQSLGHRIRPVRLEMDSLDPWLQHLMDVCLIYTHVHALTQQVFNPVESQVIPFLSRYLGQVCRQVPSASPAPPRPRQDLQSTVASSGFLCGATWVTVLCWPEAGRWIWQLPAAKTVFWVDELPCNYPSGAVSSLPARTRLLPTTLFLLPPCALATELWVACLFTASTS